MSAADAVLLLAALLIVLVAVLAIATADVLGAAERHRQDVASADALVERLSHGDPGDDALGAALARWRDQSQE